MQTACAQAPTAPTGLVAVAENQRVNLAWSVVSGASSYNIYRGTATGSYPTTVATAVTGTNYINSSLTNGTQYFYVVTATNGSGSSGNSNEATTTPNTAPSAPTGFAITGGTGQLSLTWTTVPGLTYKIYRYSASAPESYAPTYSGVTTVPYTDGSLTNGTAYNYKLAAVGSNGSESDHNLVTASATPIGQPTALTAKAGNGAVVLSWTAGAGDLRYNIYRGASNAETLLASDVSTLSYTDNSVTNGSTYYYKVSGTYTNPYRNISPTESTLSAEVSASPLATLPVAPTGLVAVAGANKVYLSWTSVSGATSYKVYRGSKSGGPYSTSFTSAGTNYTDTTAFNGSTGYYYVVTALNGVGESGYSSEVSALPPGGAALNAIADSTVDSSRPTTIFGYNDLLYVGALPSRTLISYLKFDLSKIGSNVTGATLKLFGGGEVANCIVTAVSDSTWSESTLIWNNRPALGYNLATLTTTVASATQTCDVTQYIKAQQALGATYVSFGLVTDTNSASATLGWYSRETGSPSQLILTTGGLASPINLSASSGNNQVTLNWNAVNGAANYKVKRATTSGGTYTLLSSPTTNTYTDNTAVNGTAYYYVVTAVDNNTVEGNPSNEASATPSAGNTAVYRVNGGGAAVGSFAADQYFTGGSAYSTTGAAIDTSGVTNPAPQGVYQSAHIGSSGFPFTYTFGSLTAGATYTLRLHFADYAYAYPGQHIIGVAINGTTVLPNFDIIATTGSPYKAIVEQFNVPADASGNIAVQFSAIKGDAYVNGIEVLTGGSAPAAPLYLQATAKNGSVLLNWNAVTALTGTNSYNVKRATISGGPYTTLVPVATTNTYTDSSVANGTTYYYIVTTTNAFGEGSSSNEARAKPNSFNVGAIYRINGGGGAVENFSADGYFNGFEGGGGPLPVVSAPIDVTGVTGPAPQGVYQSTHGQPRSYPITYTLPGLTVGSTYTIRLHFSNNFNALPGQQAMDVSINGTTVLSNFDVIAVAGAPLKAVVEQFNALPDSSGNIVIQFSGVAFVNGIEVLTGASAPSAPIYLTAVAGNAQVTLNWSAVNGANGASGATSYRVQRSTTAGGPYATITTSPTGTTYTDTSRINGTRYYYIVSAITAQGDSDPSNEASATPLAVSAQLAINCGGYAVGAFMADQYYSGGAEGPSGVTTADISSVPNPAPSEVYRSWRYGAYTYSLPGLTAGATYTVRLHFADGYATAPGQRTFGVTINGATVLTGFDIFSMTRKPSKAVVEQFNAVANPSGIITVATTNGVNSPVINGIEVFSGASAPAPALNLTANPGNASVQLTWSFSGGATSYHVKRATSISGAYTTLSPSPTATNFNDTTAVNGTTYYYYVTAVNATGDSIASNLVSAKPTASNTAVYQVNAGGAATGTFVADQYFDNTGAGNGGSAAIDMSGVVNPAPLAVYQSYHSSLSPFTYTFPSLTVGANYVVRLHFAEIWFFTYGDQRVFDVAINGTNVLNHFDVVAASGANAKVVVEQFNTTANSSGNIAVAFTPVTDLPLISAIEILNGSAPPLAPQNLYAFMGNTQVGLVWQTLPGAASYNVYRSTTTHSGYVKLNSSAITTTNYSDTTAVVGTSYYYVITAVNSVGESTFSNEAVPGPAFTLTANMAKVSSVIGDSTNSVITAACSPGFAGGTVTFAASTGVPANTNSWLLPNSLSIAPALGTAPSPNLTNSANTTLYFYPLVLPTPAAAGTYTVNVTGTLGDYTTTVPVTFVIKNYDPVALVIHKPSR